MKRTDGQDWTCPRCGYDLVGGTGLRRTCPECGQIVDGPRKSSRAYLWRYVVASAAPVTVLGVACLVWWLAMMTWQVRVVWLMRGCGWLLLLTVAAVPGGPVVAAVKAGRRLGGPIALGILVAGTAVSTIAFGLLLVAAWHMGLIPVFDLPR